MTYSEFTMIAIEKGFVKSDILTLHGAEVERLEYWTSKNRQLFVEVLTNQTVIIYVETNINNL